MEPTWALKWLARPSRLHLAAGERRRERMPVAGAQCVTDQPATLRRRPSPPPCRAHCAPCPLCSHPRHRLWRVCAPEQQGGRASAGAPARAAMGRTGPAACCQAARGRLPRWVGAGVPGLRAVPLRGFMRRGARQACRGLLHTVLCAAALPMRSRHGANPAPAACPAGDELPSHLAVVRDAFGAHDDSHRKLAAEVAALGPHKVPLVRGRRGCHGAAGGPAAAARSQAPPHSPATHPPCPGGSVC